MSYRSFSIAIALAAGAWASASAALAENRIALVIGNSNYETVTALPNPANDAKAMTELLTAAGFEIVPASDLTQSAMRRTIGDFAARLATMGRDTVALVFYAGHGLQVDGENYLVPIDVRLKGEADVPLQAVRLTDLMNALAAVPSKMRIVILDACRNNPFAEIKKTGGRGLAIVDAPTGSIVSYSTAPGSEAEDGDGVNSPYTGALLTIAREPGVPLEQAFKRVRSSVHQATNGRQTPWESSSLTGDFFFFPGGVKTTPAEARAPAKTPAGKMLASAQPGAVATGAGGRSVESWRRELQSRSPREAYDIVIREDTVEAYQAYLMLYPTQPSTPRVREILDRRRLMIAWYVAVTTDTPAAYQAFLASYPNSDLSLTAQRLFDRAASRTLAAAAQTACACPQPGQLRPQRAEIRQERIRPEKKSAARNVRRPAEQSAAPRAAGGSPGRVTTGSGPRAVPASGPPPSAGPAITDMIGIGIGIGLGSRLLGPRRGPTPGHAPTGQSAPPMTGPRH